MDYYNIRMEHIEEGARQPIGFHSARRIASNVTGVNISETIALLSTEREKILSDDKLSSKQKMRLLENNRKALIVLAGGSIKPTDNIIYSILIFGAIVIFGLSLLNIFADLAIEITLTFVGTVMGGTIATIAQKIGKV